MGTSFKSNKNDFIASLSAMRHGDTLENVNLTLFDQEKTILDVTNSTILCHERYPDQYYYEVFSNTPLEGSSHVFPIHTTFKLNAAQQIIPLQEKPPSVLKKFNKEHFSLIKREHMHGKTIPYLNIQPIVKEPKTSSNRKKYLIMDRIPGSTLRRLLDDKTIASLDLDKKLMLLLSLFESLQDLHKKRLIHTNIQPENIMINFAGEQSKPQVRIINFKCAKTAHTTDMNTLVKLGKRVNSKEIIRYMSDSHEGRIYNDYTPLEANKKGVIGIHCYEASDVYSLGKICYDIINQGQIEDPELNRIVGEMTKQNHDERIELDQAFNLYSDWMLQQYKKIVSIKQDLLSILSTNPTFASILQSENIDLKSASKQVEKLQNIKNIREEIPGNETHLIRINEALNVNKVLKNFQTKQHDKLGNTLIECFKYATKIAEQKDDTTINDLKLSIIKAVYTYVQETYQSNRHNRATFEIRIKNINNLLTILNDTKDTHTLKEKIIAWNKTITKGWLGRSKLYDVVSQAAKITPAKSVFWPKPKNATSIETNMTKNSCDPVIEPTIRP